MLLQWGGKSLKIILRRIYEKKKNEIITTTASILLLHWWQYIYFHVVGILKNLNAVPNTYYSSAK